MKHQSFEITFGQLASGDQSAWDDMYECLSTDIYRFYFLRIGDQHVAEDLTSLFFTKLLKSYRSFQPAKATARTWCYAIARRILIDHFRKKPLLTLADTVQETMEAAPGYDEKRYVELFISLHTLSPLQQDIIRFRFWEDLSFSEIAAVLGTTEAAAKMQLQRGLKSLRNASGIVMLILLTTTL
jgi:RNA polymerase sigma-70 factor, ECF subfamily